MSFSPDSYRTARHHVANRFMTTYGAAFGDHSGRSSPHYDSDVRSLPPPVMSRRYGGLPSLSQLLDFPFLNDYYQQPTIRPVQNDDNTCRDCIQIPKEQLFCGHRFCSRHFDELSISDNPVRRRRQYRCATCGKWTTRDDYFISYASVGYTAGDPPSDRTLGRLARALYRDSPRTLAMLLDLPETVVETARDPRAYNDEAVQRMRVLYSWRMANSNRSTADLVNIISRTNSYYYKDVTAAITDKIKQQRYDIPEADLDTVPQFDTDLYLASQHIGPEYPFLMLELGLAWMEIETQKYTYVRDLTHVIYQLLLLWRVKNYQGSTLRQLLDAANFVGINTSKLERQIKTRQYPAYRRPYMDMSLLAGSI